LTVAVYLSPGQVPFASAVGVQDAVTVILSGDDPQLGKAEGDTVTVILSGSLEETCRVTGETDGLHVNES